MKSYRYPSKVPATSAEFRGVLFFIHGFTDHCLRIAHVGAAYSALGYDFYCMDQRGHGRSEGVTVRVPGIREVEGDTIEF